LHDTLLVISVGLSLILPLIATAKQLNNIRYPSTCLQREY